MCAEGNYPYFEGCVNDFPDVPVLTDSYPDKEKTNQIFKCNQCSYTSKLSGNVKRHYLIHTGQKPYKCNYCGKSFNQKVTLKGHMRCHTGERPYSCDRCPLQFKTRSSLISHFAKHLVLE